MAIALGIVSLFPSGGLQRNCLAIARILQERGHKLTIFAARIWGTMPNDLTITLLANNAWTNHGRNLQFAADLAAATQSGFRLVVGFDKLSNLDLLYCADPSVVASHSGMRLLTPRHRVLRALEGACFAPGSKTRIIALSQPQIEGYRASWDTEPDRIVLLPPNLEGERRQPQRRSDGTRQRLRVQRGLKDTDWSWLAITRQAGSKGLDRTVAALTAFPAAHLTVVGLDSSDPSADPVLKLARRLGVEHRLALAGVVSDEEIPALMAAADILVHPARVDTTGTVILEAIINGLPVLASAVCGYAWHVREADAGLVMAEPFEEDSFLQALSAASDPRRASNWTANGIRYGQRAELYSGLNIAAEMILRVKPTTPLCPSRPAAAQATA